MAYAIVDIETTGGHAANCGITEVSVFVHDGQNIVKQFSSLVNPQQPIPYYIRGLTGITDQMVAKAPLFEEIAADLFPLLNENVFVAHSVNFDYSFLKHEFARCGYDLNSPKLCTIRLSRKIFPGLSSYGLGKICGYLDIPITDRHRAGGDAAATVKLFELLLQNDKEGNIEKFLKRTSREQVLPPNLKREDFDKLPHAAGVYYFHDNKGKIVYVGKAKNIRKRVSSHFSNNSPTKQKQDFLRSVHSISHEVCGNELMALILESHQIKQLWPAHNRSQKRFEAAYGIVNYQDQRGFHRLAIEKMKRGMHADGLVSNMVEGYNIVRQLCSEFSLCLRLVGLATDTNQCIENGCACMSEKKKDRTAYNKRVIKALKTLSSEESFAIVEEGRKENERGIVVVNKGVFRQMGYMQAEEINPPNFSGDVIKNLPLYKENFNIRQIISSYVNSHPENVVHLD